MNQSLRQASEFKNLESIRHYVKIAILQLGLLFLTGCMGGQFPFHPEGAPLEGISYGAAGADGFVCPNRNNVLPNYDRNLDGTEFYKVCHHEDDKTLIHVTGSTVHSPAICIYPVEVIDEGEGIYLIKPDINTGGIFRKCISASRDDGFYSKTYYDFDKKKVHFEATSFNAVFIIEAADQDRMDNCLVDGNGKTNIHQCPDFSWGRFR